MTKIQVPQHSLLNKKQFLFGVATSSYQIEGDVSGRLPCIWDTFCAKEGKIEDKTDGSVACEHIKRMHEDVELIASLGVDAYRFSISWPRVMNRDDSLNTKGVQFYIDLVEALSAKGIASYITLYHWDLPQHIEDEGGWLNRNTAYRFERYAEAVAKAIGNKAASFATFNEPFCSAFLGYEDGVHAPGLTGVANGRTAAHHILLAHGLGIKALRKHCLAAKLGIVLNFTPCYPKTDSPADVQATKDANEYINHWYIKPLFDKRYPDVINKLKSEDRPPMQEGDFEIMAQSLDFLGVNYYTRLFYSQGQSPDTLYFEHEHQLPITDIGWEIYPPALTELLVSLNEHYSLPPIYITENGAAMPDQIIEDGRVLDADRIAYYNGHLNAVHDAIEQGVNIQGYFAWSLMDNFEWAEGLSKRFGIVHVDYDTQVRTPKSSALAYNAFLSSRE